MNEGRRVVPTEEDLAWASENGWDIVPREDLTIGFFRKAPLDDYAAARIAVFPAPHGGWWSGYVDRRGALLYDNFIRPVQTARQACEAAWRYHESWNRSHVKPY